jgi:hypothetical protein
MDGAAAALEGQRCYRITVRGRLSEHVVGSAFAGMRMETAPGETTLVGPLVDQSALYGVLDRLRDFGLDLVRVEEAHRC